MTRAQMEALVSDIRMRLSAYDTSKDKGVLHTFDRAAEDAIKAVEDSLCNDEGCPHHGTPHVCNPGK